MSRAPGSLSIYLAYNVKRLGEPRLLVARNFSQADSMIPPGWATRIASTFECYRLGKVGVELEYFYPPKKPNDS